MSVHQLNPTRVDPVLQANAMHHLLQCFPRRPPLDIHTVHLDGAVSGMEKPVGGFPIVREEKKPGTVAIQAADMKEVVQLGRKQIIDRLATGRILTGRHVPARLVQHNPFSRA